jgi:8-oxo-dGTP diphosphatase
MQVVVGIIINVEQEILIAQRPFDKYKGGLWEFPGGKVEANESQLEALQRELLEEIGVIVQAAEPWLTIQHDYGDRVVQLNTWLVTEFSGQPQGREGQAICWISKDKFSEFEFPAGNQHIIEQLQIRLSL